MWGSLSLLLFLFFFPFLSIYAQADTSLTFTEIMFNPQPGNNEFIEIYNLSKTESIDVKGYKIVYSTSGNDEVTSAGYGTIIPPNSFAAIFEGDYDFISGIYNVPEKAIILKISDNAFGSTGMANTSDRQLWLLRPNEDTLETYNYTSDNSTTISDEKILIKKDNSDINWSNSLNQNGTPGRINSITPKKIDLSVVEIFFHPRFPVAGEDVSVSAKLKNNGSFPAENFSVEFYFDSDSNKIADHLLDRISGLDLQPADSVNIYTSNMLLNLQSKILIAVRIILDLDEDPSNNYAEKLVQPGAASNTVLINEVMYSHPDEHEWFEIVNAGNDSVNLKNWSVSDILPIPTKSFICEEDFYIRPGEFAIVTSNSSIYNHYPGLDAKVFITNFGTLSNFSDGIIIYDFRDGIIDSLMYKSFWGGKNGYSLERITLSAETNDSTNWVTSLSDERSTPGKKNSIYFIPVYERNQFVINEIMFDPDIDNSEFIECYNRGDREVNIGGWMIEDEKGNCYKFSDTCISIASGSYFLLIADSITIKKYNLNSSMYKTVMNTPSLGLVNTGELILLKDARRNIIDSIPYSDKWHNKNILVTKNRSLERISPSLNGYDQFNWSTSVNPYGATPGKQNSIFIINTNKESKISVAPNPFSPDNDGFEDFTSINYNITQTLAQVRIKIFDSKGRLIRTLINDQTSASSGSVVFDGLDDEGRALRIGIYIIFMEALNENSGIVETLKTTVVVARKL